MCDPGGLEVSSDQTQSEEPQPSRQHVAEEIQVPVCLSVSLVPYGSWKLGHLSVCVCVRARRRQQQQQREAEKWEEELKYQVRKILQSEYKMQIQMKVL